jgi:DNA-binding PadR family transcriptional regulator
MFWQKEEDSTSATEVPSLSRKEALILEMLVGGGRELYGLEMVDASNGELKRGTIYVTLQRMEDKGLIESRQEARTAPEVGIPRRMYRVTGYGQRVFSAYQAVHSILRTEFAEAK